MSESTIPTLTLDPNGTQASAAAVAALKDVPQPEALDESAFTEEERKVIDDFSQQIDVTDSNLVLQYGAASQRKIAGFSETALSKVRTKDLGEVGDMVTDLIAELKDFNVDGQQRKGLFGWLRKAKNNLLTLQAKYEKASVNVDRITSELENHQVTLMKDIAMLDEMYQLNLTYFKELSMYILAGKKRLAQLRSVDLVAMQEKAKASGLPEDAQAANDFAAMCDRFEKKIHDLELTRMVSIQMSPQIRLVQNNDTLMAEKIQSTIVNTIPLWKSQMVIAMGLSHSQQAMEAQREVTNMTNDLLRKNADALKIATVETAKESERGIVDIETLKHTNETLISTLDEVIKIQDEGRRKRAEAEVELGRLETELKNKLLDIRA